MSTAKDTLFETLRNLGAKERDWLVRLSYSMPVRAPRPRLGMHRLVVCDSTVVGKVCQLLGNDHLRVRLAVPADVTQLSEKTCLEVYNVDGRFQKAISLTDLSEDMLTSLHVDIKESAHAN